jgi:hypothetical protein
MTERRLPEWLILCAWRALLGEIYPEIRAIALSLSKEKTLHIRYYLDRDPNEYDYESISVVETNISSMIGRDRIESSNIECIHTDLLLRDMDSLDGFIYARREY